MNQFDNPFLWIGEHPCLDLVNTEMMIDGELTDLLRDFGDVARWAEDANLLIAEDVALLSRDDEELALRQTKELRAVLRSLGEGLAEGNAVSPEVVAHINKVLKSRVGFFQLEAAGESFASAFVSPLREPLDVVARLAGVAADFLTRADLSRVKKCGNPACVLLFLDTTKSRTRRWCSMEGCGNRHKVAAHYARRKKAI